MAVMSEVVERIALLESRKCICFRDTSELKIPLTENEKLQLYQEKNIETDIDYYQESAYEMFYVENRHEIILQIEQFLTRKEKEMPVIVEECIKVMWKGGW